MSSQSLYRRWRPRDFSEVVGQEHVSRTLQNALREGRVSHAYLFAGPRGTGKTSMARILAKAVNCLNENVNLRPDNTCSVCQAINESRSLDLIEIDAASNTSVDDVRDLRDKVSFRPSESRYKVYIIDEVHMLSNAAFNALLKTLEEPPEHVIFVLATTEPHKIPATILSRCQRFDFRPLSIAEIEGRLAYIAEKEGVEAEKSALTLIARNARGSLRDAITMLEQAIAFGGDGITREQVLDMLGAVDESNIVALVEAMLEGERKKGIEILNSLIGRGIDPQQFAGQAVDFLRDLMLLKAGGGSMLGRPKSEISEMESLAEKSSLQDIVAAIRNFEEAFKTKAAIGHPALPLEIAFLSSVPTHETQTDSRKVGVPAPARPEKPASQDVKPLEVKQPTSKEPTMRRILAELKKKDIMVQAIMRSGKIIKSSEDELVVGFKSKFHKQKMDTEKARAVMTEVLESVFGRHVEFRTVLMTEKGVQQSKKSEPTSGGSQPIDPVVKHAIEKYGGRISGNR